MRVLEVVLQGHESKCRQAAREKGERSSNSSRKDPSRVTHVVRMIHGSHNPRPVPDLSAQ